MRMDWIGWAFAAKHESGEDLNAGEKLVLVYLAHQVSADGWGIVENRQLCAATSYEVRSIQRILKSLRDSKLLREIEGHWYALGPDEHCPPPDSHPVRPEQPAARVPGITQAEAEAAGATIAECVGEAADLLLTRLNEFGGRLAGRLVELVAILDDVHMPAPVDPVKESPLYQQLIELGIEEAVAYEQAARKLQIETPAAGEKRSPADTARHEAPRAAPAAVRAVDRAGGGAYADTPRGRFQRVWDILHAKPPTEAALEELLPVWEQLEADENKHSVDGEPSAFELLYPAIVKAAEWSRNALPMREFLDPKAIKAGRAPWDTGKGGSLPTDGAMAAEVATMLEAIQRANHPLVAVPDRVTEKGEDGITRTENMGTFYLRVKRVYQHLRTLQDKGV